MVSVIGISIIKSTSSVGLFIIRRLLPFLLHPTLFYKSTSKREEKRDETEITKF